MSAGPMPTGEDFRPFDTISLDQMLADADRASAQERHQRDPSKASDLTDARRVVTEEMALKTLGRDLSPQLTDALQQAWVPLMCVILSRRGVNSKPWEVGIELLERLLDLADPPDGRAPPVLTVTRTLDRLARALRKVGVPVVLVGSIYSKMLGAFSGLLAQSVGRSEADLRQESATLLKTVTQVLDPETWFEFHSANQEPQWLKPQSFSPQGRIICFIAPSNGKTRTLNLGGFLDQLVQGQICPVNPTPRMRALVDELIAHRLATMGA